MEIFNFGFIPVTFIDILDISVVAFLIYKLQKIFLKSIVLQGLYVLFLIFGVWRIVDLMNMSLTRTLLDKFLQIGTLALVVIFAPEIRRLLVVSHNTLLDRFRKQLTESFQKDTVDGIEEIIQAIEPMSRSKTGVLIVLLKNTNLDHIIVTGDTINATLSSRLLQTIFNKKSPLHDGAVLVKDNKILAARCVLPVSDDPDLPPELGLRHRSAVGITEVSDTLAIVVSEETGKVTVAINGRIKRSLSNAELKQFLTQFYGLHQEQ